ncbi:hypothetical protein [Halolamina salina]|uniref:Small CPxCG-related zinc finger protein n=1 Tax=Halolamina salina TaxID=1220023 RepID=A0ABD6B3R3_9EURY
MTDGTLRCPECGITSPESTTELRPGDICPDCRRGYLETTEAALRCPECGITSSESTRDLRPGDICPDCHRGYLELDE